MTPLFVSHKQAKEAPDPFTSLNRSDHSLEIVKAAMNQPSFNLTPFLRLKKIKIDVDRPWRFVGETQTKAGYFG